jgi:hypothetical protein
MMRWMSAPRGRPLAAEMLREAKVRIDRRVGSQGRADGEEVGGGANVVDAENGRSAVHPGLERRERACEPFRR